MLSRKCCRFAAHSATDELLCLNSSTPFKLLCSLLAIKDAWWLLGLKLCDNELMLKKSYFEVSCKVILGTVELRPISSGFQHLWKNQENQVEKDTYRYYCFQGQFINFLAF